MSDTMHIAYQLNMRYVDMLKPVQYVNPEDIIKDVMEKGGLKFERI